MTMGVAGQSSRRRMIYGGGWNGLVVADTAVAAGFEVMGFLDDDGNDHRVGP